MIKSGMGAQDKWLKAKFDRAIRRVPMLGAKNKIAVLVVVLGATLILIAIQVMANFSQR